jgi:hypothetical protein
MIPDSNICISTIKLGFYIFKRKENFLHSNIKNADEPPSITEPLILIIYMKLIVRLIKKVIRKNSRMIFFVQFIIYLFI